MEKELVAAAGKGNGTRVSLLLGSHTDVNCRSGLRKFTPLCKAAEQGQAGAQVNLIIMLTYGQCVKQDYAQAAEWYNKAAEQGHFGEGLIFLGYAAWLLGFLAPWFLGLLATWLLGSLFFECLNLT